MSLANYCAKGSISVTLAEQVQPLRMRLSELEQRLREQQEAERLLADFCKRQGKNFDIDELEAPASGTGSTHCLSFR